MTEIYVEQGYDGVWNEESDDEDVLSLPCQPLIPALTDDEEDCVLDHMKFVKMEDVGIDQLVGLDPELLWKLSLGMWIRVRDKTGISLEVMREPPVGSYLLDEDLPDFTIEDYLNICE